MCGRYELVDGQRVFIRFHVANTTPPLLDNHDVRPTQPIPVLTTDRVLSLMRWGITPTWSSKPLINARAEGIETKPAFRPLLPQQRCLIPASAFFEWAGQAGAKTKYRIARRDGDLFAFAGLYRVRPSPPDGELHECTIITTTPNGVLAPIHNRMPVMLLPEDEERWLDPDLTELEHLRRFLVPYPDELLEAQAA
jgi:putative SOS response-associated peptidase YedK